MPPSGGHENDRECFSEVSQPSSFRGLGKQGRVFWIEGSALADAHRLVMTGCVLGLLEQSLRKP